MDHQVLSGLIGWLIGFAVLPPLLISLVSLYPVRRVAGRLGLVDRPGVETQLDLSKFTLGVTHSLRLFVSDRVPVLSGGNGMELPDGSDGQYDFYQWTFQVVEEGTGICALGNSSE